MARVSLETRQELDDGANELAAIATAGMSGAAANFRQAQDAGFTGLITAVRGDFVDVEARNADGRRRTVRNVRLAAGYRRAGLGDSVNVSRLSDGRIVADGLPSDGEGGRSATFWARVTQTFTNVRKDSDDNDQTYTTRAYVTPLKASGGAEVLAYTTSQTDGIEVGDEVKVERDDGGFTDDSRDGYAELYVVTSARLPSDFYDRVEGRPEESYTIYQDIRVGTAKPATTGNGVRARAIRLRFRETRTFAGTPIPARWYDSSESQYKPDGGFSVRDFDPQIWKVGGQNATGQGDLDEERSDCEVWVDTVNAKDSVEVKGGAEIQPSPERTDMEDTTGSAIAVKYQRWKFTGKIARSVSIFEIDITSAAHGKSARYTIALEKNNPYR